MKTKLIIAAASIAAAIALSSCSLETEENGDIYKDVVLEIQAPQSIKVLETAKLTYIATKNGKPYNNLGKYIFFDCDGITRGCLAMNHNEDMSTGTYEWIPKCAGQYTLYADFGTITYGTSPSDTKSMEVFGPIIRMNTKDSKLKIGETITISADITDYYDGPVLTDITPTIKCSAAPSDTGLADKIVSTNGRFEFDAKKDGTYKFIAFLDSYNGIEFWQREVTILVEK